ncbi:MAG: class I SAM-dependent methyltransferase [Anaerolineae bacterium]|nr:class I SAM-dependent methyltransferase [Anaerolineae bacterium]
MSEISQRQLNVMNSAIRGLFQRYYELPLWRKLLAQRQIDLQGKAILDAGCGSGYSTRLIWDLIKPASLYAFDITPQEVDLARKRCPEAQVFLGDLMAIDLPSESFDAVFTFGVFHHVPDFGGALDEVYRVLRAGGVFIGAEPLSEHSHSSFNWPHFWDVVRTKFAHCTLTKIYLGYFAGFLCIRPPDTD